ncbi:MAG: hypothetical protein QOJ64_4065 [Acidobacteriota bacterium]|nr:hypothetical protein [Acidobacteriota bacterium]
MSFTLIQLACQYFFMPLQALASKFTGNCPCNLKPLLPRCRDDRTGPHSCLIIGFMLTSCGWSSRVSLELKRL